MTIRFSPQITQPTRVRAKRTVITIHPSPPPDQVAALRMDLRAYKRARAKWFRKLMKGKGLTMGQLSRMTAIDLSYVSRIISGARMPGLDTCMRLARALGVGLEEIAQVLIPDLDVVTRHLGPLAGRGTTPAPAHEVVEEED